MKQYAHEHIKADGRSIYILDNLFDYDERDQFYCWATSAPYSSYGQDTSRLEHRGDFNLFCPLEEEQVEESGFWKFENSKFILPFIDGYKPIQARLNLSTLHDRNRFHCDTATHLGSKDVLTLLYYVNMEWNNEWGGYTLFTNKSGDKLEYCSFYVPGRVILFDGLIPHCISAPSPLASVYRYSFVIQYMR